MHDLFTNIAEEENCELYIGDEKFGDKLRGTFIVESTYQLKINDKNKNILIQHTLGAHEMAEITVELPKQSDSMKFTIATKSHISTLFSRNKDRVKITCKNLSSAKFFEENDSMKLIRAICIEAEFEPYITGSNENGSFKIRTDYHLLFEQRNLVLRPLINLCKALINRLL